MFKVGVPASIFGLVIAPGVLTELRRICRCNVNRVGRRNTMPMPGGRADKTRWNFSCRAW